MNIELRWIFSVVFVGSLCMVAGCQESATSGNLSDMRQVRLIANENMQLQKQLEERDRQIKNQERLLSDCEQKIAEKDKASHEADVGLLDSLMEEMQKSIKLSKENEQLNIRIKELQAKLER